MKTWKILTATLVAGAALATMAWAGEGQKNMTPMSDSPGVCKAKCNATWDFCYRTGKCDPNTGGTCGKSGCDNQLERCLKGCER